MINFQNLKKTLKNNTPTAIATRRYWQKDMKLQKESLHAEQDEMNRRGHA